MKTNATALPIVEDMISWSDELRVDVREQSNATIIDCSNGGYDAGAFFSEICMGGLGTVGFTEQRIGGIQLPAVQVHTDFPILACLDCQKAEWPIGEAIGSGPARCLNNTPNRKKTNLEENYAILAMETSNEPDKETIAEISSECGVNKEDIFIIYAPTNSLVGSIQISARVIETAVHKLERLGFPLDKIDSGFGTAPIAPISESPKEALGKTNDAIVYGGTVNLQVDEITDQIKKVVSENSDEYGKLMNEVFKEANYDFYKIDDDFFAPAEVVVNSIKTGEIEHYGSVNEKLLKKSFELRD